MMARALGGLVLLTALLAGCSSTTSTRRSVPPAPTGGLTATAPPGAAGGGCGSTPARVGGKPAWAPTAPDIPYVLASPATAAGFLFADPLRAGHVEGPANKILWVVSTPRTGPLVIDAHPAGMSAPAVHLEVPDNSSPGEIYPSIVDLPTSGCWELRLRWGSPVQTASVDLQVTPA
jgi:hypothetical protein